MYEELLTLYSVCSIICVSKSRRQRLVKNIGSTREIMNMYKMLVRKPEGKRPL
jgi:hypothetical protein